MKLPVIRQLPSGSWFCQLRLGGRSISITEPTEAKCRARAMAYKTGLLKAQKAPASLTLRQACHNYNDARRGVCSPTTIDSYEKIAAQYFQALMGKKLSDITAPMLEAASRRERQRVSRRGKPLSPKTIKSALGYIKCVLNENSIDIDALTYPEVKRRVIQLPDPEKVIAALIGSDIELPCLLAAWLSLSMSELRGLTKSRSILDGKLYIVQTMVTVKNPDVAAARAQAAREGRPYTPRLGTAYIHVMKEGGKEEERPRALDIPPYIQQLIDRVPGDRLCPFTIRQLETRFSALLAARHLPRMTFHQLRHLNASVMAMLGIQKEIAQERGGWKTDYVMNRVYTHTFDAPRREADQKINAYFNQIANKNANASKKRRIYKLYKHP